MIDSNEFQKLGIVINANRTSGNVKTYCPECEKRNKKKDLCLSVNLDTGAFNCHRCGFSGYAGRVNNHYSEGFEKIMPKTKIYLKPNKPDRYNLLTEHIRWFENRGISQKTLETLRIYSDIKSFTHQETNEYITKNCIVFPYFEEDELINKKYRTIEKEFKFETKAELIPFNINSIKGGKECIITEGEIDAISFIEAGFSNAISVPNGAGTNLNCFERFKRDYFDDKQTIVLALDDDEQGLKLKDNLKNYFPAEKIKILYFSDNIKDANEELTTHGVDSLKECYNNASPYCIVFDE